MAEDSTIKATTAAGPNGVGASVMVDDAPIAKLDAEEFTAEDLDAIAEGLSGSGNLNYALLQAQQGEGGAQSAAGEFDSVDQFSGQNDAPGGRTANISGAVADVDQSAARAGEAQGFGFGGDAFQGDDLSSSVEQSLSIESAFANVGTGADGASGQPLGLSVPGENGAPGDAGAAAAASDEGPGVDAPDTEGPVGPPGDDDPDPGDGPIDTVDDIFDDITDDLGGTAEEVVSAAEDVVDDVVEAVEDVVDDLLDGVGDLLGGGDGDTDLTLDLDLDVLDLSALDLSLDVLLDPIEVLVGDIDIDIDIGVDLLSDLGGPTGGLGELLGGAGGAIDGVGDTVGGLLEGADAAVGSLLDGFGDGLLGGGLLGDGDTGDGDTDLTIDAGVDLLDQPLVDAAADVALDPVEAIVGDIDIDVAMGADLLSGDSALGGLLGDAGDPAVGDDPIESVADAVGGLADGLLGDGLLGGGLPGDSDTGAGDTDLTVDTGVDLLDQPLVDAAADVTLDPVEAVVGDIDVDLDAGLDLLGGDGLLGGAALGDGAPDDAAPDDAASDDDTDLVLDTGVDLLDQPLVDAAADVTLDPVEALVGDIDIELDIDLDLLSDDGALMAEGGLAEGGLADGALADGGLADGADLAFGDLTGGLLGDGGLLDGEGDASTDAGDALGGALGDGLLDSGEALLADGSGDAAEGGDGLVVDGLLVAVSEIIVDVETTASDALGLLDEGAASDGDGALGDAGGLADGVSELLMIEDGFSGGGGLGGLGDVAELPEPSGDVAEGIGSLLGGQDEPAVSFGIF